MASSHDSHDTDAVVADDNPSTTMKWLGPIIALLFCAAILAGIGVANAASYDGELPKGDDYGEDYGDGHGDDDDHGDDEDHGNDEDHGDE